MSRWRSPSASLAALLAVWMLSLQPHAQTRPGDWFSIESTSPSPLRQRIEQLVTEALRRSYSLSTLSSTSSTLSATLASRAPTDLIFIAGRAAEIAEFVRTDRFQIVEKLKLEVVNARLGATPFYLFTNGDKQLTLSQGATAPRVLYASRAGALAPNDVQQLLLKMLRPAPTVLPPLNSPAELARRLLGDNRLDGVDVVGIFDDEPSPFLHDFLRAYDVARASAGTAAGSRQLVQMLIFPTGITDVDRDRLQTDRLQAVRANLAFALVRFNDVAIEALDNVAPRQKDGVLAVSTTRGGVTPDTLWVLSNVRSIAGAEAHQRLRRLLGDAYFVGLIASDDFHRRCESGSGQYSAYLLDAQTADRENLAKALAFWSDLVLRSGRSRPTDEARLTDQRALFTTVLRERLNVQVDTKEGQADILARLRGPRATVREQFSDADGMLFRRALDNIQAAVQTTDRTVRLMQLAAGRAKLLALVEKGSGPACRGKDLGLFGRGADPFFYLGLVDAYAAIENATQSAASPASPIPR